jgi:hypothetical protein
MPSLPITVPNIFANATSNIALSLLDADFATVAQAINGIGNGSTPLTGVSITGGTVSGADLSNAGLTFTNYTPVITGGSGTIGSYTAGGQYTRIGRLVYVVLDISITDGGSGGISVVATLPITANQVGVIPGRETAVSGSMLQGFISGPGNAAMQIFDYKNSYPGTTGARLIMSGTYQSQ